MKKILYILLGAALAAAGVAIAQPSSQHNLVRTAASFNVESRRECFFPSGGWTIVDCSNVAADTSAQLNAWSRYVVQCGDDSYFATGTSDPVGADASDGYVPADTWTQFHTTDTVRFFSCLNVNVDSDCRYIECR
jgi:hypothetical protein